MGPPESVLCAVYYSEACGAGEACWPNLRRGRGRLDDGSRMILLLGGQLMPPRGGGGDARDVAFARAIVLSVTLPLRRPRTRIAIRSGHRAAHRLCYVYIMEAPTATRDLAGDD